jgi:hypothetical protein
MRKNIIMDTGLIIKRVEKVNLIRSIGTMKFESGERYEGNWERDRMNGRGTFQYTDGNVYTGDWIDNERNGTGTYQDKAGGKYFGSWLDDKPNGYGNNRLVV